VKLPLEIFLEGGSYEHCVSRGDDDVIVTLCEGVNR